jgi:hypothetical protein
MPSNKKNHCYFISKMVRILNGPFGLDNFVYHFNNQHIIKLITIICQPQRNIALYLVKEGFSIFHKVIRGMLFVKRVFYT